MKVLSSDRYERVMPLVLASGMRGHLAFVYEVIEGLKKGFVYVDHPENPSTALICNKTGFFFAFGEPDEETVRPVVLELWQNRHWPHPTTLFGSTAAWSHVLSKILEPLGANPLTRIGFELHEALPAPPIPLGYTLHPITIELARSILDGTGTSEYGIDPWFIRICGGAEEYAAFGLGLAIVCDGQIASLCGFCALAKGEAELEVGTVPTHRGKGLAVIVGRAFMDQCRMRGYNPIYTCTSTNHASRIVARKLGYVEVEEVTGYDLPNH